MPFVTSSQCKTCTVANQTTALRFCPTSSCASFRHHSIRSIRELTKQNKPLYLPLVQQVDIQGGPLTCGQERLTRTHPSPSLCAHWVSTEQEPWGSTETPASSHPGDYDLPYKIIIKHSWIIFIFWKGHF